MIPKPEGFALQFLPQVQERWAELIRDRRTRKAPAAGDLRALEASGASPAELAALAPGYHYAAHVEFRGLSGGLSKLASSAMDTPLKALWLMDLLDEPEEVMDLLGIERPAMLRALLEHRPASEWLRKGPQLDIPPQLWAMITPEGLVWRGPAPMPPMPWPMEGLGDGLRIEESPAPLDFLQGLHWHGTLHLKGCHDLTDLHLGGGPTLIIEDCRGLRSLTLEGPVTQATIRLCPRLESVAMAGKPQDTPSPRRPPSIWMDGETVRVEHPDALVPTRPPSLTVETCRRLSRLKGVHGQLTMESCHDLQSLRHSGGPVTVIDCQGLVQLRMEIGDLSVSACPCLQKIHRSGSGSLSIEDCPALETLNTAFPGSPSPSDTFTLRRCPSLREVLTPTHSLRHCGPMVVEDCPSLQTPMPHLHILKELQLSNCQVWEAAHRKAQRTGWHVGGPETVRLHGERRTP